MIENRNADVLPLISIYCKQRGFNKTELPSYSSLLLHKWLLVYRVEKKQGCFHWKNILQNKKKRLNFVIYNCKVCLALFRNPEHGMHTRITLSVVPLMHFRCVEIDTMYVSMLI